jgi:PAT family acetyl-CoA transporter-like MFS transporter 1
MYVHSSHFSSLFFEFPLQLLSPTVILPLGILVPIIATKVWHNSPLKQFMTAYKLRVTLVPMVDVLLLLTLQRGKPASAGGLLAFWSVLVLSTALQAIVSSLQFNAQMSFFAHRVDPAIGGSYMTLLNTAANLGGTWPAPLVMWLVSVLSRNPHCTVDAVTRQEVCTSKGRDPFFVLQLAFSALGCLWILLMGRRVEHLSELPDDAWRTHILDKEYKAYDEEALESVDVELPASDSSGQPWQRKESKAE